MSTWHVALRLLGLRDRAEVKSLPRTLPYWLSVFAGLIACGAAGALAGNDHWAIAVVLFVAGLLATFAGVIYRDRDYLRAVRKKSER
jgi:uncharacterized membrane protein YjjP (DUF1212 family)